MDEGDIFDGLSLTFPLADEKVTKAANLNNTSKQKISQRMMLNGLSSTSEVLGVSDEVEGNVENKRVKISQHRHKRVCSDPDNLSGLTRETLQLSPKQDTDDLFPPPPLTAPDIPPPMQISIATFPTAGASTPNNNRIVDDFLSLFPMSELKDMEPTLDDPQAKKNDPLLSFHNTKLQQEVQDYKLKRKRPGQHARSNSNPASMLHNLDQIRQLSRATSESGSVVSNIPSPIPQAQSSYYNSFPKKHNQFNFLGDGSAPTPPNFHHGRSLSGSHPPGRPTSLHNHPRPNQRPHTHSYDMSDSYSFENDFGLNFSTTTVDLDEKNRKQYKCGRCGKPKVGHVCTMPDQRNNFSQVDLEITKGIKHADLSHKVLLVSKKWVPMHEDYLPKSTII